MDVGVPSILSGTGVAVAAVAYYNLDNPGWQRGMRAIYGEAIFQVALGALAWVVLNVLGR
jgi:hypothetical protein